MFEPDNNTNIEELEIIATYIGDTHIKGQQGFIYSAKSKSAKVQVELTCLQRPLNKQMSHNVLRRKTRD